ncbi:hypothetical protein C8Q80DRAFT_1153974 [Daedaleopsis nitida]|nr:hypothetical protein C8Q80DRAFT_1153974 [Daedaleopsis nitida]
MASGARTRKSTATPELDVANLSTVERLIFAQAVHEFGSGAWPEVAKLLSKHPLISQPDGTFTPQSCSALYKHLMDDAGLEWSETQTGPRLERNLRLAQKYYVARIKELRELIAAEEQKFKTLVTEIDEIRSGEWDDKIRVSMGLEPPPQREEQPEPESEKPLPAESPAAQLEQEEPGVPEPEADASAEQSRDPVSDDKSLAPEQTIEAEHPPIDNEEREQEERSDNDAVNELIGHLDSDKPTGEVDVPDDAPSVPAAPEESPAEVEEDEMQVDQEPIKHEEEEADESSPEDSTQEERQSLEPDAEIQEAEEADAPSSEPSPLSRVDAKRKASDDSLSLEGQRERKRLREESEPADEDDGLPKTRRKERAGDKRFQNMIGMLHSQISQHRYGNIFHNPIKKSEAPDYHDIVKRPMDLKTIKARVKDGLISTSLEFQRDIFLMFANAMMYNRPGSEIYNMAEEMMVSSERDINAFRQTEGFHRM